jgi:OmpA-OmpF porin, OOP family
MLKALNVALRTTLSVAVLMALPAAYAQKRPAELPGGKDHPAVSRFNGAVLENVAIENFVSLRIPQGPGKTVDSKLAFDNAVTVEGKLSAYYYVQPASASPLEVLRNYQSALTQAGFKPLYSCEVKTCSDARLPEDYRRELLGSRKWQGPAGRMNPGGGSSPRELRYWSGKATRNGADIYAIVWVAEPDSIWNAATTAVVVVEPAAMEGGKVNASLELMKSGLSSGGKIALYGLYFDTGKAEVKPESKPQLDEMAKLLNADPGLRVFIVGHTDNQGVLDANVQLSQKRAEAVVAALVQQHGIDGKRLAARGVANLSPVASNAAEGGRAKNRRVELVAQ